MSIDLVYIIVACIIGLIMAWGIGANDLANIMSTTMGSKAITVKQALVIAVVFEFAGALLGGTHVTNTIRTGIINIAEVSPPVYIIYGMLSVLLASSVWIWLASFFGMPVSITNAIVGALVGFGAIVLGVNTIHWQTITHIAISWVCSPLIAGIVAFLLFNTIRKYVLSQKLPAEAVKKAAPFYLFLVGVVLASMIVIKGLEHFDISLSFVQKMLIDAVTGSVVALFGMILVGRVKNGVDASYHEQLTYVEKVFGILMALTACAMVFAHGSNDVAIAVGPIAAVIGIVNHGGQLTADTPVPLWIVTMGCVGVVLGLFVYGRKVIETVGSGITALTPSRAFCATLAAATTVIVSTSTGIPVSATQTLVGAVLGVGLARGIGALNLIVIRNIILSWIITLPAAAVLAVGFFFVVRSLFQL